MSVFSTPGRVYYRAKCLNLRHLKFPNCPNWAFCHPRKRPFFVAAKSNPSVDHPISRETDRIPDLIIRNRRESTYQARRSHHVDVEGVNAGGGECEGHYKALVAGMGVSDSVITSQPSASVLDTIRRSLVAWLRSSMSWFLSLCQQIKGFHTCHLPPCRRRV